MNGKRPKPASVSYKTAFWEKKFLSSVIKTNFEMTDSRFFVEEGFRNNRIDSFPKNPKSVLFWLSLIRLELKIFEIAFTFCV